MHQAQVQVAVGAVATAVYQGGFGRQVGFVDQRVDGQVRQAFGEAEFVQFEGAHLPAPELGGRVVQTTGPLHQIGHALGGQQLAGGVGAADAEVFGQGNEAFA